MAPSNPCLWPTHQRMPPAPRHGLLDADIGFAPSENVADRPPGWRKPRLRVHLLGNAETLQYSGHMNAARVAGSRIRVADRLRREQSVLHSLDIRNFWRGPSLWNRNHDPGSA